MRRREQALALEKRFREAALLKERADGLQARLALQALGDRQRDEVQQFEDRRQQGLAFIDAERRKARWRIERLMGRADGAERSAQSRRAYLSGWRERAFRNFDGLALRRYCAERRSKTAAAPARGRSGRLSAL
jgi:hypothetical protein